MLDDDLPVSRDLLSRAAVIPCLAFVAGGQAIQAEVIEALEGRFAARTVIESLKLLAENGYISSESVRFPFPCIRYQLSRRGHRLANRRVGDFTPDAIARKGDRKRPKAREGATKESRAPGLGTKARA